MQVHGATQPFGQAQQGQQVIAIAGAPAEGRPEYPPQQATRPGHPPGQLQPRRAGPEGDRHQGHQLQLQPALPALLQLQQGLPARLSRRPGAVHMAAQAPQAIAPGPIQARFAPLQHLVGRALVGFAAIGGQGRRHRRGPVGKGAPTEGLIEMDMGIHGWRQRQGSGGQLGAGRYGLDGADAASADPQAHRHQPLTVASGQACEGWIQEGSRQAQGRQPAAARGRLPGRPRGRFGPFLTNGGLRHGAEPGPLLVCRTRNWPAPARVRAR